MALSTKQTKPTNLNQALVSPRYLISKWPWLAALYAALGSVWSMLTNTGLLLILLVLSFSKTIRHELWPTLVRWDVQRLRLVDPALAERLDQHLRSISDTKTELSARQYLHLALVTFLLGPLSIGVLIIGPLAAFFLNFGILDNNGDILRLFPTPLAAIVGVVAFLASLYLIGLWSMAMATLAESLLRPTEEQLANEIARLETTRTGLLDAATTERTRIERALHDGTQHRLVALSMQLGLAEATATNDETKQLANTTQKEIDDVLTNLRDVIRNIQPQALTERGLAAAVADITASSPIPVHTTIPATRLGKHVEECAFFVTSEALSNVIKHSNATQARVDGIVEGTTFTLTISDNGDGGATEVNGHGIEGLKQRAAAIDGTVEVNSPAGGPTTLTLTCPLTNSPAEQG